MTSFAGVARDADSLVKADHQLTIARMAVDPADRSREARETANLLIIGAGLVLAASAREETRGCHTRTDFPATRAHLAHRLVVQ